MPFAAPSVSLSAWAKRQRSSRSGSSALLLIAGLMAGVMYVAASTAQETSRGSRLVLENCGTTATYVQPPARAVTLNQAATEVMLALGLHEHLVGTAYLDDAVLPQFDEAYRRIPVLANRYPAREILLAARPDFIYASYPGAFTSAAVGTRDEWAAIGVHAYLAPAGCLDRSRQAGLSFETTFAELRDVARVFGVPERAEALIAGYRAELDAVRARIGTVTRPPRVFWFDEGEPLKAGACCGAPNEILRLIGAENIFADARGSWAAVSWEAVIARNPDVIVLANASWSTAEEKRTLLLSNSAYAGIEAVRQRRFVSVDFAYTTPGIRNIAAVRLLATALYPDRFR